MLKEKKFLIFNSIFFLAIIALLVLSNNINLFKDKADAQCVALPEVKNEGRVLGGARCSRPQRGSPTTFKWGVATSCASCSEGTVRKITFDGDAILCISN